MNGLQLHQVQQPKVFKNRFRALQFKFKKPNDGFQDYDLQEQIGQGGFGKVKKAVHKPTGVTVAVKVLKFDKQNSQLIQAIQKQIKIHQKLLHENIVQIYEVIRKENQIYIFMELCQNGDLFDKISSYGPMSQKQAVHILHQILSALLYLKKMGVSHRDIKPENIVFDSNRNAKIVDFGFSCRLSYEEEKRKTACGTPSYTPPQVLLKTSYSAELMDVWCLGATFFTMLAAQNPFLGDTHQRKKANIISFNWLPKVFFSQEVCRFLSSIFTQPKNRATLQDLNCSQLLTAYQFNKPNFIDYTLEIPIPEETILQHLQKQFRLNRRIVSDSIKFYQLDKNRAHYYIILSKLASENISLSEELSKFKKQRKSSQYKLQPLKRNGLMYQKVKTTQNQPKKQSQSIRRPSLPSSPRKIKLRKKNSSMTPSKFKNHEKEKQL